MNAEYLAIGPKVPTAWDSTDPGVSENKVWEAISGINGALNANLKTKAMAIATLPAHSPPINDNLMEICFITQPLNYFNQATFKFFPGSRPSRSEKEK